MPVERAARSRRKASDEIDPILSEPFPPEHLGFVHEWLRNYPLIGGRPGFPSSPAALTQAVETHLGRSWAVSDPSDPEPKGFIYFERYGQMGMQGFAASSRKIWGTGWMAQCARAAIDLAFEDPALGYIFALVLKVNHPAVAYVAQVGMRLKNVLPDYSDQGDMLIFELTREQWSAPTLTAPATPVQEQNDPALNHG